MGRGRSGINTKANGGKELKNFSIAFSDDRLSFNEEKREWEKFERSFGDPPTRGELRDLSGYVATGASFTINRKLYTPELGEKALSDSEKRTVKTLDRMVDSHVTPKDAKFVRYIDGDGATAMLGMNSQQSRLFMDAVKEIQRGDTDALAKLNKSIVGATAHSASFTSTSATSNHLFSSRLFKREIDVQKGTKAFATNNRSEHEVIFGRNMNTSITGISFDGRHIVIHESFENYNERKTK